MITFTSFLNPGAGEGESIGRCYTDKAIDGKYLDVIQAEDYVLFRLIHQSKEQRYAYDSFRKIFEARIAIADIVVIEELIDIAEHKAISLHDMHEGDEIGFMYDTNNERLQVGGRINGKLIVVDLDLDDANSLSYLLQHMRIAYDEYLANKREHTATLREWKDTLINPDAPDWVLDMIRHQLDESGATYHLDDTDNVTLTFDGDYHLDAVQDAFKVEREYSVEQWVGILANLDPDIAYRVKLEIGWIDPIDGTIPYGLSPSVILTGTFTLRDNDAIVQAGYKAWLSAIA